MGKKGLEGVDMGKKGLEGESINSINRSFSFKFYKLNIVFILPLISGTNHIYLPVEKVYQCFCTCSLERSMREDFSCS